MDRAANRYLAVSLGTELPGRSTYIITDAQLNAEVALLKAAKVGVVKAVAVLQAVAKRPIDKNMEKP